MARRRRKARRGRKAAAPRVSRRRRSTRRRARKNYYSPGLLVNPRRKRSRKRRTAAYTSGKGPVRRWKLNPHRRRRSFRRNPGLGGALRLPLGLTLPPLKQMAGVAAGFTLPAIVEGYVFPMLPMAITGNQAGVWISRIVLVSATGAIAKKVLGNEIGNAVLVGGGAYLLLQAVRTFAPGMIPGVSGQPLLGYHAQPKLLAGVGDYAQPFRDSSSSRFVGVPDRLNPVNRY